VTSSTYFPVTKNRGDSTSFFEAQQNYPTSDNLITSQANPTLPQDGNFVIISNPIIPSSVPTEYVKNFDPDLYDLTDSSHLMRLIAALTGPSGTGRIKRQNLVSRLSALLSDGAFLDLDQFYGALFNFQRGEIESMPQNLDGSTVNPYTDLANSDIWDEIKSKDSRYRARIFQLARAINMGATLPGLKAAAEAILSCDVDVVESWVTADLVNTHTAVLFPEASTYTMIENLYGTFGGIKQSFGSLAGSPFGQGNLPLGNRGEVIFTPQRVITEEERYQAQHVLAVLRPSNVMVTVATTQIANSSTVVPRLFASDSENWQIQSRVTQLMDLINPPTEIYSNTGEYSQARPAFGEYTGEKWTYNPNVSRTNSYQLNGTYQTIQSDQEVIFYRDGTIHVYAAADSVMDSRQALSPRLSGQGPITSLAYSPQRAVFSN
jgi:hypothetical protein